MSKNPKMKGSLVQHLPSEMIINIISRLPIPSIFRCKCVCKSWLDLVESREFAKSHLSESVPGFAVFQDDITLYGERPFNFCELVDEPLPNPAENTVHQYSRLVSTFKLPHHGSMGTSVNGLLFYKMSGHYQDPLTIVICNPITREYIKLPPLDPEYSPSSHEFNYRVRSLGFGVSKKTGQYKLVILSHEWLAPESSKCEVYTLGMGSWRSIDPSVHLKYFGKSTFLNGNLHWLEHDIWKFNWRISCFDLETELFSIFSPPPDLLRGGIHLSIALVALEECLVLSCYNSRRSETIITMMDKYGDDKSWTKKFMIGHRSFGTPLLPIKVFKDGDILFEPPIGRSSPL